MMYHPKSVGKVADIENLTLCISLNSGEMCTYFLQGLSYRVQSISNRHPFSTSAAFICTS